MCAGGKNCKPKTTVKSANETYKSEDPGLQW